MNSNHYVSEREKREQAIKEIGEGKIVKVAYVDRHHKNGPEIHCISDTGIITVYNQITRKMVTKLIARPGQIERYYEEDEEVPKYLIDIAKKHKLLGLNNF